MAENNPFPGENNTGHFWDDNLRELANPPPQWWMIGFWASIAWVILYTLLFPSWPSWKAVDDPNKEFTKGLLGWTQMKEFDAGVAQVEAVRGVYEAQIKGMSPEDILKDPGLTQYTLASAKVLFGDNCAACHGSGGQGNPGYPVLADDDWLYKDSLTGASLAKVKESMTIGRKGAMTAHKDILAEAEVGTLAHLVTDLADGKPGAPEQWALFNAKGCTACHGPKGNGVLAELPDGTVITVGAANLTDRIWRFEPGGYDSARHTILYGVNQPGVEGTRDAVMPAFGEGPGQLAGKLNDEQIKKLAIYVHTLGGGT